ncbi:BadF/BadG/BcrA/BcrD ATPase family protein [Phytomonospora sp. NPDC050363]|uniref:N-acetylglucosamine kinase n=1 Tax=Phytomonospora sp. NPDC050363 TaxID=3155642 RepID=UPI0033DBEFD4
MELVLGVDAGGTATRAVAATLSGEVVGRGDAGPGNPIAVGNHAAADALAEAVGAALSGHDAGAVLAGALGLAGSSRLEDPEAAAVYAARWQGLGLACPMRTYPDVITAFTAATPAPTGSVLIAGTGAVAARVESWRVAGVADGLGWLLGDEGSGFWLGLRAVRSAARMWTQASFTSCPRPLPALVGLVARHARACDVDTLVDWAHQVPRGRIAALAPLVCAAADDGDPDCARLADEAAASLLATLGRLDAVAGPVVLSGGLLMTETAVRVRVVDALRAGGITTLTARDAAIGATWLAARAGGGLDDARSTALHARLLAAAGPGGLAGKPA